MLNLFKFAAVHCNRRESTSCSLFLPGQCYILHKYQYRLHNHIGCTTLDSSSNCRSNARQIISVVMRRQSFCSNLSSGSGVGEPLIVVEESTLGEEEADRRRTESPPRCVDPDSPSLNPYLLSPWRDARKHSLPTPQCTSGITASQVRTCVRGGSGHRSWFAKHRMS